MKLKLNVEELTDDFFCGTRLLGIIASVKNYQFCWQVNSLLGYRFRLNPEIEIQLRKKERAYFFPVYEHRVLHSSLNHYLYHNCFDGEYLLPEFRHIDFLWLMKGDAVENEHCEDLIRTVKEMNGVQMVSELFPARIKTRDHLVF